MNFIILHPHIPIFNKIARDESTNSVAMLDTMYSFHWNAVKQNLLFEKLKDFTIEWGKINGKYCVILSCVRKREKERFVLIHYKFSQRLWCSCCAWNVIVARLASMRSIVPFLRKCEKRGATTSQISIIPRIMFDTNWMYGVGDWKQYQQHK